MGILDDRSRQRGVRIYDPVAERRAALQRQAPQPQRPAPAFNGTAGDRVRAALLKDEQQQKEEEGGGNAFGRGLGFLVNNPVTQVALKPLQYLDYGRRAVTLGMEEFAEGITGSELKATEGDERSNWDKLNDPEYGVGQLLGNTLGDMVPGTWNDSLINRAGGFIGDVAFDPLSYVGGIGIATKAMPAGGRAARLALANRALNQARRAGASADEIAALTARLQQATRRGLASTPEIAESVGARGGVRLTTNPFSPYRGAQATIPGSEKVTNALSRARTRVGDAIGSTNTGRKLQGIRTPKGLEDDYLRAFHGLGDTGMEVALDNVNLYQKARRAGAAFSRPLTASADRLVYETRNMPTETKHAIIDSLENEARGGKLIPEAKPFRRALDTAWKRAQEKFGLPVPYREGYAPHILTRDAMEWRRDPTNAGNIVAPNGFFTQAKYDPSGVTMARQFEIGDEFVVNGVPIKIEKGTVREINDKFRAAGMNFDFFETDPGIIVQKYINMLSDDVGVFAGTRQLIDESGGRGLVKDPTIASGRAVDQLDAQHILRGGGAKEVLDGDLASVGKNLGVDLDPAVYRVRIDPEATKGVNATTVLKSKKQVKLLNEQLAEARDALDTKLRLIAKGEAGFPGLPSLKAELKTRKEAMKDLVSRAKQAEDLIAESTAEQSLLIDRIAWHQGVVQEIDDELKRINFLIDEIQSSAPKEVMSELQSQRRILTERFEASRSASERARSRIRARTKFEGSIDDVIEQRRAALYEAVGAERPQPGTLPGARTGPVQAEPGPAPYPAGRRMAEMEVDLANALATPGAAYKAKLKNLAKATGKSEDEILNDLARRGVDVAAARPAKSLPSRAEVRAAVLQAKEQVREASRARLMQLAPDYPPPSYKIMKIDIEQLRKTKQGFDEGPFDALKTRLQNYVQTKSGKSLYNKMIRSGIIDNVGGAKPFMPDEFAQIMSSSLGRDVSVDEAINLFFDEAERFVKAGAREPSRDVLEVAAKNLGLDDTALVAASRSEAAWGEAAANYTASKAAIVPEVAEVLGEDAQRIAAMIRTLDPDDPNLRVALIDEVEDALMGRGLRMEDLNDYADLYEVDTEEILSGLEAGARPAAQAAEPPPQAAVPTPAAAAAEPPAPRAVDPMEYEELSRLRAQRKALIDEANSVPGLKRANQEIDQRLTSYMEKFGVTDQDVSDGYMAVNARLNETKQRMADEAQRRVMDGDEAGAKALIEELGKVPNEQQFLDEYDRLTAKAVDNTAKAADIEGRAGQLKADIDNLTRQIDERSADIASRVPVRGDKDSYEREFNRLMSREEAASRYTVETQPTVGKGGTPNLEGASKGYNLDPERRVGLGAKKPVTEDEAIRQVLIKAKTDWRHLINARETRLKNLKAKVAAHPQVQRAKARVTRASISQGAMRRGKVALPERPGKVPKNLRDFPDWDEATKFWNEQVDEIIAGRPVKGGPDWASPKAVADAKAELERVIKEVSEAYDIPAVEAQLKEALEGMSATRGLLDKKVFVGDDARTVRILSERIKNASDPGELATLRRMELEKGARQQQAGLMNEADAAIASRETAKRQGISDELIGVEDQIDELATNPQAREALSREAMDQPEAQKVVERKRRLESESNASKAMAAASEAKLGAAERSVIETQAELADIYAGQIDATKLVGQAKGTIERAKKLNPKNRGKLKVEEFLQQILDADPGLKDIDNQATVFAIVKAEDDAQAIKGILESIENAKLSAKGDHLSRVVDVVLEDTWKAMMPDLAGPNGPIIHRDLARRHNQVVKITHESNFWRHVDTLTGLFKTYATLTPGFHVRNALSAAFMNASDGIPTKTMIRGTTVMREYGQAAKQGDDAVLAWLEKQSKIVLNEETGATMLDALDAAAGTGIGGRYREHGVGDRSLARNRITEKAFENRLTHYIGKQPGTFIESSVRLPATMDALIKGGSVEEAVMRATRLHFDYSEVSNFDQTMRRLIPFWTFMSRNLPLQVAQMYTNPRAYAKYNSFIRNFKGTPEENEPEYFSKIGAFRLADVEVAGLPIYLQPDLPHTRLEEDIEKIEDVLSLDNPARALSDFNPLMTAPAEYISNQNFYTGRQYGEDDYRQTGIIEAPIAALARALGRTKETPGGKRIVEDKFLEAFRSLIPIYDRSVRLAPQLTTGGNDGDAVARQIESAGRLVGLPVRQLSPQQQQAEAMRRYYSQRDVMREQANLARLDR